LLPEHLGRDKVVKACATLGCFVPFRPQIPPPFPASSDDEQSSECRAALYSLLIHHAETLPSHPIPLPYLPAATSNPLAWALLVSALERRARCSTGGSAPFSSGGEMSERKRGSSAGEESSTMSVPAKKARGEGGCGRGRGRGRERGRGRGRGRGRDNTSVDTSLTLLPPGEGKQEHPARVLLASCLRCWKFPSSSWFLAEAGGTGPLHPQAAARGAGEEENAVAQQGGSRGDGLVTRDLISAFDRPSASSVNDAGTRTLDLISSMDPRGVSSTNHEGTGRAGFILSDSPPFWTVT
jgi:hypothetical protein